MTGGLGRAGLRGVLGGANWIEKQAAKQFFNTKGTWGTAMRYGAGIALGGAALTLGKDSYNSLRSHQFGSALLSGALAVGAGFAAHNAALVNGGARNALNWARMSAIRARGAMVGASRGWGAEMSAGRYVERFGGMGRRVTAPVSMTSSVPISRSGTS